MEERRILVIITRALESIDRLTRAVISLTTTLENDREQEKEGTIENLVTQAEYQELVKQHQTVVEEYAELEDKLTSKEIGSGSKKLVEEQKQEQEKQKEIPFSFACKNCAQRNLVHSVQQTRAVCNCGTEHNLLNSGEWIAITKGDV